MDVSFQNQLKHHLLAILVLSMLGCITAQEEETSPIKVGAPVTAVAIGDSAEIECTVDGNDTFAWYTGEYATDDAKITENTTFRIFANLTTGLLTIQNAVEGDTGTYLCQTDDGKHNVTAELHVYEMPSYFTEGLIILVINAVLVVLFVICGLYTYHQNRQRRKAAKAKPQKKILTEL